MFFAATHPHIRRNIYAQNDRSLEQYLEDALKGARQPKSSYTEDETLFTLLLDMPGIAKEQLTIAIDGSAVRVSSKDGAKTSFLNCTTTCSIMPWVFNPKPEWGKSGPINTRSPFS